MDNRNETENDNITDRSKTVEPATVETADTADGKLRTADEAGSASGNVKKIAASVFDVVEMFVICTMVILLVFSYIARLTVVEGTSMEDTLHDKDYLIVQGIGYTPHRGDIVVIHKISAPSYPKPIIKRVIAVGGDTVDIDFDTWTVYVNGEAIDEPYTNLESGVLYSDLKFPLTVDEGKIFVLGDHRNHSSDSRVAQLGQIDERCVVGRAIFRILPFDKIGVIERAEYN